VKLFEDWKELIIVPVYKKGNNRNDSNYTGISLLPVKDEILSNILLSSLTPYTEEIIRDHQCGFQCKRTTTICIYQILEKKQGYIEAVHQLLIDLKEIYNSVRREVLCTIPIVSCIPMKLVRIIKLRLNETYSRVWVGKHLSDMFLITNGLKHRDVLSQLLFNFAFAYVINIVQANQDGIKLNGTHQLLVYADAVNILGKSAHTIKKNRRSLRVTSKEMGLEVNADRIKNVVMF
jgi:hypothetical protein